MKKTAFLLLLISCAMFCNAQQAAAVDSMKGVLRNAKTTEEKIDALDLLSRMTMNVDLKEADKYGEELIRLAEESRDRKLMVRAYLSNGTRCSYYSGAQNFTQRATEYYNKGLSIAKQNRMDEEEVGAYIKLSSIHLTIPDKEKALSYANQAFSVISGLKNDSLLAAANNAYGDVYLVRNEKILALRHYLSALRLAEEIKNASLERACYQNLSGFYAGIEDYDRAIDYATAAYGKLDQMEDRNVPYQRAVDNNTIGRLYSYKKNHSLAISYFERSLAIADSLKFSTLKVPAYTSLLNQYLRMDQPARALEYFNSTSGQALKSFLTNFGFSGVIDQAYAVIYTELDKLDSAKYYFEKAMPYFEKAPNELTKMYFRSQLGNYYKKRGENQPAIDAFLAVKAIADKTGQLDQAERAAKQLDTLYNRLGDFKQASVYSAVYYQYKDSIEKLNKEKELSQIEAQDEQYRQKKREEELAEKKRRRNSVQYMGITIGIAALFIMLVVLGMFRVSTRTIRLIGFFAFIMFFEFIFLIFKKNIHSITDGEPLKDLAFMIALAALLVPLHHWLEHKVIHYLTSHNMLTASGKTLLSKVFVRKVKQAETKV